MLIRLGDDALKRLLDLLREQTDSNERVRIMRLVISAGRRALPLVRDRIHKDQSWYVLRNIAYILGHIGDESSAKALQPLLLHENSKVRLEALKSINRTGKNERCTLLLAALPHDADTARRAPNPSIRLFDHRLASLPPEHNQCSAPDPGEGNCKRNNTCF